MSKHDLHYPKKQKKKQNKKPSSVSFIPYNLNYDSLIPCGYIISLSIIGVATYLSITRRGLEQFHLKAFQNFELEFFAYLYLLLAIYTSKKEEEEKEGKNLKLK